MSLIMVQTMENTKSTNYKNATKHPPECSTCQQTGFEPCMGCFGSEYPKSAKEC